MKQYSSHPLLNPLNVFTALQELIDQHSALHLLLQRNPKLQPGNGTSLQLPFIIIQVGGSRGAHTQMKGQCCSNGCALGDHLHRRSLCKSSCYLMLYFISIIITCSCAGKAGCNGWRQHLSGYAGRAV
jgi:hypothetical protein